MEEPDLDAWAAKAAREESPEVRRRMADLAAGAGREAAMTGEPDEGVRWMAVACQLDPERQDLRCALAAMEVLRRPDLPAVQRWAVEVRERWPHEAVPVVHATVALHKAGRSTEGLMVLLGLIADAPALPGVEWRAVGGALLGLGRYAAAEEAFSRALASGADAQTWLEMAVLAEARGQRSTALERIDRALALDPEVSGGQALRRQLVASLS